MSTTTIQTPSTAEKLTIGKPGSFQKFKVKDDRGTWIMGNPLIHRFVGFSENGLRETKNGNPILAVEVVEGSPAQDLLTKVTAAIAEEMEHNQKEIRAAFQIPESTGWHIIPDLGYNEKKEILLLFPNKTKTKYFKTSEDVDGVVDLDESKGCKWVEVKELLGNSSNSNFLCEIAVHSLTLERLGLAEGKVNLLGRVWLNVRKLKTWSDQQAHTQAQEGQRVNEEESNRQVMEQYKRCPNKKRKAIS